MISNQDHTKQVDKPKFGNIFKRQPAQRLHWSELILRLAMIGVSTGSVAQMLGYHDLGNALVAVGGACGANAHLRGG